MSEMIESAAARRPALPLFYRNPQQIEPARHGMAGLREAADFGFARGTNAIALAVPELAHAARSYPVVFSKESPTVPFAIVGVHEDRNLFVDAAGKWRQGAYIPAYVRRYPFI